MENGSQRSDNNAALATLHTVLVADDDMAIQLLIRRMLERVGYAVFCADSGEEALSIYAEQQPDLVLLDAVMPGLDGFETTERLVAEYGDNCAPIMIITSLNNDESVEQAFQVGATDFVTKPIQWSVMLKRMNRLMLARDTEKVLSAVREQAVKDQLEYEKHLRQAQKNEAIGRFANGLAHDFGNTLTAISGYAELAERSRREGDEERLGYCLSEIRRASERAGSMVQSILEMGGRARGAKEQLLVHDVINEVVALLKLALPPSVVVRTRPFSESLSVEADPIQLQHGLMNLILNAREAVGEEGVIEVSAAQESVHPNRICAACCREFSGDYISLSVSDTGCGIAQEDQDRIFEPFYSTKPAGNGVGMGLAVVNGFIHQHLGHIQVESNLGKGSQFTLYLPVMR